MGMVVLSSLSLAVRPPFSRGARVLRFISMDRGGQHAVAVQLLLQDLPYFDLDKALHAYLAGNLCLLLRAG
jgi:hypothetical protein